MGIFYQLQEGCNNCTSDAAVIMWITLKFLYQGIASFVSYKI